MHLVPVKCCASVQLVQCRTPSRGIPLISEASEMAINCFSDKYMKILYTIFSVWKEKRGETVLRAVASALVLPELIKLRTTFVGTAVGVAHCCCTYPLAGPRLLPLAKVSQGYECPTIVGT